MSSKLLAICALLLCAIPVCADQLVFDSAAEWATWEKPFGLTQVGSEGQLQLVKFRKDINAVQDAHLFAHETKRARRRGFRWHLGSGVQPGDGRAGHRRRSRDLLAARSGCGHPKTGLSPLT